MDQMVLSTTRSPPCGRGVHIDNGSVEDEAETFAALGLREDLLRAVTACGFTRPLPAQRAYAPLCQGKDVFVHAPAGAGRTSAVLLGALARVDPLVASTQVLYLSPTRELAMEASTMARDLANHCSCTTRACVGGSRTRDDDRALRSKGVQLVIGTVGRVKQLLGVKSKPLGLSVKTLILDDVDVFLATGFRDELVGIVTLLAGVSCEEGSQVVMVAAGEVDLDILRDPVRITVQDQAQQLDRAQHVVVCREEDKALALVALSVHTGADRCFLFADACKAPVLHQQLTHLGWEADLLQGSPSDRASATQRFRAGFLQALVASGAERPPPSPLVACCDVPRTGEQYLKRLGRCAQQASGWRVVVCTEQEVPQLTAHASALGAQLKYVDLKEELEDLRQRVAQAEADETPEAEAPDPPAPQEADQASEERTPREEPAEEPAEEQPRPPAEEKARTPLAEEQPREPPAEEKPRPVLAEEKPRTPEADAPSFDAMGLSAAVLRGIYAHGFERPSPIQGEAIVPLCEGRDALCQARPGTGKTACFVIGALSRIDFTVKPAHQCQALLLAPTRELAKQTFELCAILGKYCGLEAHVCIGGTDPRLDVAQLRQGQHMVVGTPGRLQDLCKRKRLDLSLLRLLVVDEADEMLGRGFQDQVHDLLKRTPSDLQVALFSATLQDDTRLWSRQFLRDPVEVLVKHEDLTVTNVPQFYIALDQPQERVDVLLDLYETLTIGSCLLYVNTRRQAEELCARLHQENFACGCIHAELDYHEREAQVRDFRAGATRVLVSTDLLAKGFDVQQVSLVINYDLPLQVETYLHRVGRAGRWGRKGVAISFVTQRNYRTLLEIERHYATEIAEMPENIAALL